MFCTSTLFYLTKRKIRPLILDLNQEYHIMKHQVLSSETKTNRNNTETLPSMLISNNIK